MKASAPSRNSRPMTKQPLETMLMKIGENTTSPEVAKTLCPMVGANCRGTKSDSKSRGYVRIGEVLTMARLYTRVFYEFRPFSEEVIALRLGARRRSTGLCVYKLQGCEPFYQWRGVAYIECARTPAHCHYRGSMYIKVGRY